MSSRKDVVSHLKEEQKDERWTPMSWCFGQYIERLLTSGEVNYTSIKVYTLLRAWEEQHNVVKRVLGLWVCSPG